MCDSCAWSWEFRVIAAEKCLLQCMHTQVSTHYRLDILNASKQKHQGKCVVHDMAPSHVQQLKHRLVEEREKILVEHPTYHDYGRDQLCVHRCLNC